MSSLFTHRFTPVNDVISLAYLMLISLMPSTNRKP